MRLIYAALALAHLRWAAWEMARYDRFLDEAKLAFRSADAHREHSAACAERAGFAAP